MIRLAGKVLGWAGRELLSRTAVVSSKIVLARAETAPNWQSQDANPSLHKLSFLATGGNR